MSNRRERQRLAAEKAEAERIAREKEQARLAAAQRGPRTRRKRHKAWRNSRQVMTRRSRTAEERCRKWCGRPCLTHDWRCRADPKRSALGGRLSRTALRLPAGDGRWSSTDGTRTGTLRPGIPSSSDTSFQAEVADGWSAAGIPTDADTRERKVRGPLTGLEAGSP